MIGMSLNRTVCLVAAGVTGTLALGFCIYLDHKRRCDPNYKEKVRENRRRSLEQQSKTTTASQTVKPNDNSSNNSNNHLESIKQLFKDELEKGEAMIMSGDHTACVEHFANAITLSGQSEELLQIMRTTLPQDIFALLMIQLQALSPTGDTPNSMGDNVYSTFAGNNRKNDSNAPLRQNGNGNLCTLTEID